MMRIMGSEAIVMLMLVVMLLVRGKCSNPQKGLQREICLMNGSGLFCHHQQAVAKTWKTHEIIAGEWGVSGV